MAGNRFEWETRQETDLRGEWEVAVIGDDSASLLVKVEGKPEKLTAKIGKSEAFATDKQDEPKDEGAEQQDADDEGDDEDEGDEDEDEDEDQDEGEGEGEDEDEEVEVEVEVEVEDEDEDEVDEESAVENPKAIELKEVSFDGYRLTASFEGGELSDMQGRAWLGLVLLEGESPESQKLIGALRWSDGSEQVVTLTRKPAAEAADEDSQPEAEQPEAEQPEAERPEAERSEKKDAEKTDKDHSKDKLVECEVNYPLGAFGLSQTPEQPEWLLVRGATLWTCSDAGILENADMLIHKGVISEIGQGLTAPEGAVTIDATGMHVSPGIIDCHSHMATDGGVNESGQAITAEVRVADFIDCNDITIYRQLAGGVTTANILHGSANPIGGQNQVIKLRWGMLDEEMKMKEAPAGIKFALGENVKQSSRPESTRYPRSRMGVEQIIRDRFEAALKYRQDWKAWSTKASGMPPRRDYELEAIAEILEHTRWVHCHSYRQDEILAMLRTLEDFGVTIGSLQHILEGYKVADAMAAHGATGSSFSDWWAYKFEVYDAIPHNGALMHKAGVVVSFNSDDDELARHLNHEAAKAVKYGGVEPTEALKFVTLNPAKQLRIDQWVGSLEPGKHADFVVWNRSPLSTLSMCTQTWIDGRKYFDRESDAAMRAANEELHRKLVQGILGSDAKMRRGREDNDPSYWWARFDEFCHDHHGHGDHLGHEAHADHEEHEHEGH